MKKPMKKAASKITRPKWGYELHELPGRVVTIAAVLVNGKQYRGVSIKNPKDSPLPNDGVKFALTRAMAKAKLSKAKRRAVWMDFLEKFPLYGATVHRG